MKIAASFSMGRLAPKHNLNIDGIRGLSKNVTPALIKDDVVIIDNLRTGNGTYQTIDEYTDSKLQPCIDQYNAKRTRQDRRITTGYSEWHRSNGTLSQGKGELAYEAVLQYGTHEDIGGEYYSPQTSPERKAEQERAKVEAQTEEIKERTRAEANARAVELEWQLSQAQAYIAEQEGIIAKSKWIHFDLATVSESNIQSGVIAPVDRISDGGYSGGIADDPDKGCGILQFGNGIKPAPLTQSADDTLAGNQHFVIVLVGADNTLFCHPQGAVTGVDGDVLVDLLQHQGTMAHIGIRGQHVTHLHEMHLLTLHTQMDGAFAAGQTAAHDDHIVTDFVLFQIVVVNDHHIIAIEAGNGRHQRGGAHGDNQGVGSFLLHILLGNGGIQADFCTGFLCHLGIGQGQLVHFILEGQGLLGFQNAAQGIFLFAEDDFVSPLCCGVGSVQAAGAAACNQNFFLLGCGINHIPLALAAYERIDGAAAGGGSGTLSHTGEAPQAANNILIFVCHDLIGQERIGQQSTAHVADICFAGCDDFLHLSRIVQTADGSNRLRDMLLNLGSQEHISAVIGKHGRMGDAEGLLVGTG